MTPDLRDPAPDPVLDEIVESAIRFFERRPVWRDNARRRHARRADGRCTETSCATQWPCLSAYAAWHALQRANGRIPQPRRAS